MIPIMTKISEMVDPITAKAASIQSQEAVLVAISGIDGFRKGTITRKVVDELKRRNLNAVLFNLDLWHHPAAVRFSKENSGEHFYHHAFCWDELFNLLITPLKRDRSIHVEVDLLTVLENES